MPLDNHKKEFSKKVCSFVKYRSAHREIAEELENHMEDHMEYLMDLGISEEEAEKQAVEAMGNPEEIGRELDKQHRPFWGWILNLTSIFKVVGILYSLGVLLLGILIVIVSFGPMGWGVDKEHVQHTININQKQKLGPITYKLKKITVMDNNTIYIRYNTYVDNFDGMFRGWSHPGLAVYDEEGNRYHGGGSSSNGIYSRHQSVIKDFDLTQENIILKGETFHGDVVFKIPLKGAK